MGKCKRTINFNGKRLFFSIQEVADPFVVNEQLVIQHIANSY